MTIDRSSEPKRFQSLLCDRNVASFDDCSCMLHAQSETSIDKQTMGKKVITSQIYFIHKYFIKLITEQNEV